MAAKRVPMVLTSHDHLAAKASGLAKPLPGSANSHHDSPYTARQKCVLKAVSTPGVVGDSCESLAALDSAHYRTAGSRAKMA